MRRPLLLAGLALTPLSCHNGSALQKILCVVWDSAEGRSFLVDALERALTELDELAQDRELGELSLVRTSFDALDLAHARLQQSVDGVPVWGGDAVVHFTCEGRVTGLTDALREGMAGAVDTQPGYTEDEAIEAAFDGTGLDPTLLIADPVTDLWVLPGEDGAETRLVWRVRLAGGEAALEADGEEVVPQLPVVFVDAHSGEVVSSYDNLQTASCSGSTHHYGTVTVPCSAIGGTYYLEDPTRQVGTFSFNSGTRRLSNVTSTSTTFGSTTATKSAVEAHWGTTATYDMYAEEFGRDGIDGSGGPAYVTSHGLGFLSSLTSYSSNYGNAYWDGSAMYFGDGDGTTFGPLTTIDIAGHELTHGVTEHEAGLVYSGESGGLNESMSDVMGAYVEYLVLGDSPDVWRIGEDTYTPGTSGDALRYMNDPGQDGASAAYYASTVRRLDVHYSSGIANLAFYLVAEGGTHPDGSSTTRVTGVGIDAAAQIWYRALTAHLTSTSTFAQSRDAFLAAATDLYGATGPEYQAVANAWAAVGVGDPYEPATACTTERGAIQAERSASYEPGSSGAVGGATQTVTLSGPSDADFDLYLQKRSGSSWSTVAASTTTGSSESLTYAGSAGTYRVKVYSFDGTGGYTANWCR